jgi:hypothetical protein
MSRLITSAFPATTDYIQVNTGLSACKTFRKVGTFLRSLCSNVTDSDIYTLDPDNRFSEYHVGFTETETLCGKLITDYYPTSTSLVKTLSGTVQGGNIIIDSIPRQDYTFTFNGSLCGFKMYGQFPVEYDSTQSKYVGNVTGHIYSGNYTLTGTNLGSWALAPVGLYTGRTQIQWHHVDISSLGLTFSAGETLTVTLTGFQRNTSSNINAASLYYNLSSLSALSGEGPRGRSELSDGGDYNINFVYSVSCS